MSYDLLPALTTLVPPTINNTPSTPDPTSVQNPTSIKYYQPPPYIISYYKYQTVNADKELQRKVTNYFIERTLSWVKKDSNFSKYKLSTVKNDTSSFNIIHHILKLFVKKGNTNWYDLKEQEDLVKNFIKYKLSK